MAANYKELVKTLGQSGEARIINGMPCIYKKSPDTPEGHLDIREQMTANANENDMINNPKNYPKNMLDNMKHLFVKPGTGSEYVYDGIPIGALRANMGWENVDLSEGIKTTQLVITGKNSKITSRVYLPIKQGKSRPCMVFIHGGGFMGGDVGVVENPCKLIAQKADAVVVSVDYRLCPEHKFPQGFDDCYDVLTWVYENGAQQLGIDPDKLAIGGDSAGGNLSAVCSLRDRDEGKHRIKYEALLYPTVMRTAGDEYEGFYWNVDMYNNPSNDERIIRAASGIREMNNIVNLAYLSEPEELHHPYVAPLSAKDFSGLPKTYIANAEYDYLLAEGGLYASRLKEAGVDVRWMVYGGVGHAYLDKLGFYPQAEDCIHEIVKDLKML